MRQREKQKKEFLVTQHRFTDEEALSSYTYPEGYKVKGIIEQINVLQELFPNINFADESVAGQSLPQYAEGWFAIPRWQAFGVTYGEAVQKVLMMIASKREVLNHPYGEFGTKYLRQDKKSVKMWEELGRQQKDFDILVVAAQFGFRHRGRTVRRAREVFTANEFGLGAFAVSIMLLTHPEREVRFEQLHVDCAGDNFVDPNAGDDRFPPAPCFGCPGGEGRLMFYPDWFDGPNEFCGSASAFLVGNK